MFTGLIFLILLVITFCLGALLGAKNPKLVTGIQTIIVSIKSIFKGN